MIDLDLAAVHIHVANNKLVADVKGHETTVDEASVIADEAAKTSKKWDGKKPDLRATARHVIDKIAQFNTQINTVNLMGTENRLVEVATSTRRKDVPPNMIEQAQALQEGLGTELVIEEVELVIKGALAKWVLKNMGDQTGNPDFTMKKRHLLVPKFEDVQRNIMKSTDVDPSWRQICDVLGEVGIFAPSVECKTLKVKP